MFYVWNASKVSIQKYCKESFYMEMALKIASYIRIELSSNLTPSESKVIWSFGLTHSHPLLTDEEGGAPGLEYIAQADTAGKSLSWNQALLCLGLMTVSALSAPSFDGVVTGETEVAPPLLPGPPERVQQWLGRPRLSPCRPGWGAWEPEWTQSVSTSPPAGSPLAGGVELPQLS